MNSFELCLQIGKSAENYVADYLTAAGHIVEDVSYEAAYMSKDIDFLLYKNNKYTTLEVKSDSKINQTGNLFFEVGFDRTTGYYDGWFRKCEAAYICFCDTCGGKCYIVRFDKDTIAANAIPRRWINYTDNCYGDALLLPLPDARKLGLIEYEWCIE